MVDRESYVPSAKDAGIVEAPHRLSNAMPSSKLLCRIVNEQTNKPLDLS
jgi:hypothetical protein